MLEQFTSYELSSTLTLGRYRAAFQAVLLTASSFFWITCTFAACDTSSQAPNISIAFSKYAGFQVESSTPYNIEAAATHLSLRGEYWQADHDYLALDFPRNNPDTPITNGDLHSLVVGYGKMLDLDDINKLHWQVVPALAVSSNQLKNPDVIDAGSFRLDGHLVWEHMTQQDMSWFAGACIGALSGEHRIIPVVGFGFQNTDWAIAVGYPHANFQVHITSVVTLFYDWSLSGNEWQVLDQDLNNRSDVNLKSKQVRVGFSCTFPSFGYIDVYWVHLFDQELGYLAQHGSRIATDMEDSEGWMISYAYLL